MDIYKIITCENSQVVYDVYQTTTADLAYGNITILKSYGIFGHTTKDKIVYYIDIESKIIDLDNFNNNMLEKMKIFQRSKMVDIILK